MYFKFKYLLTIPIVPRRQKHYKSHDTKECVLKLHFTLHLLLQIQSILTQYYKFFTF